MLNRENLKLKNIKSESQCRLICWQHRELNSRCKCIWNCFISLILNVLVFSALLLSIQTTSNVVLLCYMTSWRCQGLDFDFSVFEQEHPFSSLNCHLFICSQLRWCVVIVTAPNLDPRELLHLHQLLKTPLRWFQQTTRALLPILSHPVSSSSSMGLQQI